MNPGNPTPARRRLQLVRGRGPADTRDREQLDRFLAAPDPLLIVSLQQEEQGLRRTQRRRWLAGGLAVLLGLAAGLPWAASRQSRHEEEGRRLIVQGRKLLSQSRFDEAASRFSAAVRLAPGLADGWAELGASQLHDYQSRLAEKAFQRALALEPGNPRALGGLGNLYLRRGENRKAEEVYLRGHLDKQLARLYLLEGRFHEAGVRLAPLLHASVEDEEVYRMAEAARSRYLEPSLQNLLEPEPTGLSPWADLGWRLSKQNRSAEAAAAFGQAIARFPQDVNALCGMGSALLALNRPREAQVYFERALKLNWDHFSSMNGLARALRSQGKTTAAIAVWRQMAELYPGFNDSTPGLAWAYYEMRDYRQAAVYFARLVKKNPEDPKVIDALNVAVQNIGLDTGLAGGAPEPQTSP
jgi:tetratricopeptide (TPR) repeat protein